MKTFEKAWEDYRDACYPDGTSPIQQVETKQAFFAGATVAMYAIASAPSDSEDRAVEYMAVLERELLSYATRRHDDKDAGT